MMSSLPLLVILVNILQIISGEDDDQSPRSLCDDPLIHSADRLVNKTVRVYRGQYYWELNGFPAPVVKVEGPFKIWNLNMGTLTVNTAIVTVLEGTDIGATYKVEGKRYWAWDKDGKQFAGAVKGTFWDVIPDNGFEAAFHDGDKNDPKVIGFRGIDVYYFSTKGEVWTTDKKNYVNGKYGEKFPTDLTAAFSWPADDPKDGYIAYLFKRKKFCKRTKILKSGQQCDQWIDNKVLFGCKESFESSDVNTTSDKPIDSQNNESSPTSVSDGNTEVPLVPPQDGSTTSQKPSNSKESVHSLANSLISFILILFSILKN